MSPLLSPLSYGPPWSQAYYISTRGGKPAAFLQTNPSDGPLPFPATAGATPVDPGRGEAVRNRKL